MLCDQFGSVSTSALYQTPSFPVGSGPDFVNAVCVFDSHLAPRDVLLALHDIEKHFGRTRDVRWGQRTLDLDLIACGDGILPDKTTQTQWRDLPLDAQKTDTPDQLILPHPRVQDRAFVLMPMCDVAPDWVHPLLGVTAAEMLAARPASERAEIKAL